MILLIDNYDSFSYNLYQLVGSVNPDITVVRNDALTVDEVEALEPEAIILSPGPGRPVDAGVCEDVVRNLGGKIPIFGVCLGHQAIVEASGGTVGYAKELMHGKVSPANIDTASPLFAGLPQTIEVGRYHSLAADEADLPSSLIVLAKTDDGEIMAVGNEDTAIYGVQFHPESIMTPDGQTIISNFMDIAKQFNERKRS